MGGVIHEHLRGHWIIEMPEMIATISARNNIEAVVPFLSFLSNRSFCHNRMSPFDIRQSELLNCFLRVSIS